MGKGIPIVEPKITFKFDDLKWEEYRQACNRATQEAMTEAAKIVQRSAKGIINKGGKHRIKRRYPSGKVHEETLRLHQVVARRTRQRRDAQGVYSYLYSKSGYGMFVEYGTKSMRAARGAYSYLRRALSENMNKVMGILKASWPK